MLALGASLLLVRACDWLEEALQSRLLCALEVLGQPSGTVAHAVFAESLVSNQVLNQGLHIWCLPLEVTVRMIRIPNVGSNEQVSSILIGPVLRDNILLLGVLLHML